MRRNITALRFTNIFAAVIGIAAILIIVFVQRDTNSGLKISRDVKLGYAGLTNNSWMDGEKQALVWVTNGRTATTHWLKSACVEDHGAWRNLKLTRIAVFEEIPKSKPAAVLSPPGFAVLWGIPVPDEAEKLQLIVECREQSQGPKRAYDYLRERLRHTKGVYLSGRVYSLTNTFTIAAHEANPVREPTAHSPQDL